MKTVRISKEVHKLLREYGDGDSFNKTVRLLLESNTPPDNVMEDGLVNINFDDDLLPLLKSFRVYPTESYSSILYRFVVWD